MPHGLSLGLQFGVTVGAGSGCRLGRRRWFQALRLRDSLSLTIRFTTLPLFRQVQLRVTRGSSSAMGLKNTVQLLRWPSQFQRKSAPLQIRHIVYTNLTQLCLSQINAQAKEVRHFVPEAGPHRPPSRPRRFPRSSLRRARPFGSAPDRRYGDDKTGGLCYIPLARAHSSVGRAADS